MPSGELKYGVKTCYMNAWLYPLSKENKVYEEINPDLYFCVQTSTAVFTFKHDIFIDQKHSLHLKALNKT